MVRSLMQQIEPESAVKGRHLLGVDRHTHGADTQKKEPRKNWDRAQTSGLGV